jgi:DNA polymerase-3 subunit alpha
LRQHDITVGPGRGSAVSSLVIYLLGITKIDPLEYNLFFERFLNEKRKSPPDIDIDVENQKVVIEYLQNKHGFEKIARLATRQKLGWSNAFKEVAKVTETIGEKELENILSCVEEGVLLEGLKTQALRSRFTSLFEMAEKISDFYFNSSIHASGIVISEKKPLSQLLPLKQEKDNLVSYYSEKDLNLVGLKKYDFLNLTSLGDLREIKNILGKKSLPRCSLRSKAAWKLLHNGLVSGIPQLDTPSFRELINRFSLQKFSDLVLILALNRPGAKDNIERIWEQKLKNQKEFFSSSELNQILAETYGSIVFEEQISQILAFVFDCSFAEAETYRERLKTLF